jgi:hypothetical protein
MRFAFPPYGGATKGIFRAKNEWWVGAPYMEIAAGNPWPLAES